MKKILVLLSMIFVAGIPLAYAHPIILDSNPAQSGTIGAGSTRVAIYFSEEVELEFSVIKVLDGNGNQIDNKDTQYLNDEKSLVVTTPPLQDGIYTVTTKVLSKIDGHLVDYAFVFGVGDVVVPPPKQKDISESIYFPEAGARFPGLVGQTIVLGAAISTLIMWNPLRRKKLIREE
ncbi:MAG: copper resistance protein CopC, partial [Candidatus Nitrosotenuis sp.]|nr:copper resistance protein CopC [Candidatus Nitrosotenuis sp.]